MAQDQQSYRRAAGAAIIGLVVQIILTTVTALAGLASQSPVLYSAAYHLAGGLPIWLVLLILFKQHQLERDEALETEQLARADANTAALFDEHADDLQIARRRLNSVYKWGLGIVSTLVAIYLIAVGIGLFYARYHLFKATDFAKVMEESLVTDPTRGGVNATVPLVVSLVVAFIAFIVARYQAGMTKITEWQLLRGGASYLMGNFAVAVLCSVGFFFVLFDNRQGVALLYFAIPAIMVLQGVEVLMTFLLNAYRPRRPGEIPRPAFDSRVLGLLTTPKSLAKALSDAINYQFGFEVSRSWFYQLLGKAITPLIIFSVVVLILISSIVVVQPYERAFVLRWGRIVNEQQPLQPGLHFKLPWPIDHAKKFPQVGRIQQLTIGSAAKGIKEGTMVLWTKEHTEGKESYLVTAPTPLPASIVETLRAGDPGTKTPGMSLVGLQMVVEYRVNEKELLNFATTFDAPESMLEHIAESELNRYLVSKDIDTIMGKGRVGAGDELRKLIQERVNQDKLGIELVFVGLAGVHPPMDKEVAQAFQAQVGALQDKQKTIEDANREAIETLAKVAGSEGEALAISRAIRELEAAQRELADLRAAKGGAADITAKENSVNERQRNVEDLLTRASGEAAQKIYEARAVKWDHAVGALARAQHFEAELRSYRASPALYRARRYFQTLAEGLDKPRKTVIGVKSTEATEMRLDLTDVSSAMDFLNSQ